MKISKNMSRLAACLMATAMVVPVAWSETVLKLGWTTADSADDPYAMGAHAFKNELDKSLKDNVTVQMYPNRQLGDEKQMLEGLRFGTVDAAVITNAVVAQLEPALQLNDLPFLFSSPEQAYQVLDGKVGQELAAKLDAKGIVVLGYMEGGFRHMLNNKRPVQTPQDVHNVKYRVMQNPVFIDMFNSLGGSAVPMAWGETFTAVQQGTIDGLEIPLPVAVGNKYFEVTKFLSLTGHSYSSNLLLMSKRALNKMSPEQREAILKAGRDATAAQRKQNTENGEKLLATMKEQGMQINRPEDFTPFRQAVQPIYETYRKRFGPELIDEALKAN